MRRKLIGKGLTRHQGSAAPTMAVGPGVARQMAAIRALLRPPGRGSVRRAPADPAMAIDGPQSLRERQADRMASAVLRSPAKASTRPPSIARRDTTQAAPPAVVDALRTPGQPLSPSARAFMEPRFGHAFDDVRVHVGTEASDAAARLGANAFTYGSRIVFADGQYDPGSAKGNALLAHELAHVVQQRHEPTGRPRVQRQICDLSVGGKCDAKAEGPNAGKSLDPQTLAERVAGVRRAIERLRSTYPLAVANMGHWLDGGGATRQIPLSEFDFANPDAGVVRQLQDIWRPAFEDGIRRRLERGHKDSLRRPGSEADMRYCTSARAVPFTKTGDGYAPTPGMENDLAVAFGGYTMMSMVRVRALPHEGDRRDFQVLSWRVQLCDRYNFNAGSIAAVPIPAEVPLDRLKELQGAFPEGVINVHENYFGSGYHVVITDDDWFQDIAASGGATDYDMYSAEFDAPASVTGNFVIQ